MATWAPKSYISLSEHFRQIEAKSETEKATVKWQETQQDWETDSGIGESPPPTPSTPLTGKSFNLCQYEQLNEQPQNTLDVSETDSQFSSQVREIDGRLQIIKKIPRDNIAF